MNRRAIQCVLATDVRLQIREESVWAEHSAASYATWIPFVEAFSDVYLVGRDNSKVTIGQVRVDGPGVTVVGVPTYSRLLGLMRTLPQIWRVVMAVGSRETVFVGRLPEPLSLLLYARSRVVGGKFIAMVVSEPRQLFSAHMGGMPGRLVGAFAAWITRAIVKRSSGVVYVSREWLQNQYPAAPGSPTLARSDVVLTEDSFRVERQERQNRDAIRIITIGSLTGRIKGMDLLIEVVSSLRAADIDASMEVLGSGQDLDLHRERARECDVEDHVTFRGHVSDPAEVRQSLDAADIYLSASRAEGLPRATVEAMARGLAVISSKAGAASELVDPEWLVDVEDVEHMVLLVKKLMDPALRAQVGAANQDRAHQLKGQASPEVLSTFLRSNFA